MRSSKFQSSIVFPIKFGDCSFCNASKSFWACFNLLCLVLPEALFKVRVIALFLSVFALIKYLQLITGIVGSMLE